MLLPAHLSVHTPTDRPGYLNLTHTPPSPRPPTQASCLPFWAGEGGEGLGRSGAGSTLVPSLRRLARSFLSGSVSRPSPGSGSPGCSGQTPGGLVSADARQQRQQQGRGGCGRLCQRGRRRAGRQEGSWARSAPTHWGRQNQGGWVSKRGSWARGPRAQPGLWAHTGPRLTGWPRGTCSPSLILFPSLQQANSLVWMLPPTPKPAIQFSAKTSWEGDVGSLCGLKLVPSPLRDSFSVQQLKTPHL